MKLQVIASENMCARIDKCAKELGMTRSAFCLTLIAKGLPEWEENLFSVSVLDPKNADFEQVEIFEK